METAGVLKPQARYGLGRVLEPPGAFQQLSWKVDPDPRIPPAEIPIDVQCLMRQNPAIRAIFERRCGVAG
ncbi:MAG TPA: hypothetical protein VFW18_05955 [Gaiellales bacterium]|nr:hypothetical protein [Gaiellales bacterium]